MVDPSDIAQAESSWYCQWVPWFSEISRDVECPRVRCHIATGRVSYEYWSSLFRLMLLRNNVHWGRGCRCDDLLSLVAPRVVFVTACGATGRLVDAGSSQWQLLPVLMLVSHKYTCWVFDKYTRIDILAHWPWDQMADIFNKFLHVAGCSLESKLKNVSVV